MTQQDMELESWRKDWQMLGGREDLARSLAERVQKDGRRLRRELLLEMAAAAASIAICLWLLVHSPGKIVVTVTCAAVLVYTGVWVTRMLILRQGSSRADGIGLDIFIELTRRRLADDVKWHTFRRRSLNVVVLLLPPWTIWALFLRHELYRSEPWLAAAEFGFLIGLLVAIFIHLRRKVRSVERARERFEALLDEHTLR